MRYYKNIIDGYIDSIGVGYGGVEITEEEYNNIKDIIMNAPQTDQLHAYLLNENLEWELHERIAVRDDAYISTSQMLESKVAALESTMQKLIQFQGLLIDENGNVVKPDLPTGDYTKPIVFVAGMNIQQGLFYTDGNDVWEALVSESADSFTKPWFDVVEV